MIIADCATAVIPVNSEDSGAAAVVLTCQGTLTALCALFETDWAGAQALGEAMVRDGQGLSPQEAATIVLAQGHTDEAIAKRLDYCSGRSESPPGPLWAKALYVQRIALPQVRDAGQS
ncbi:hypothetical protein [Streptomyces erythrochromogenes]|uniref:hypothetical protein n=1 Tax=Streptomyces erythrochromogenes TaxID=285574 RepID=UPI00386A5EA7